MFWLSQARFASGTNARCGSVISFSTFTSDFVLLALGEHITHKAINNEIEHSCIFIDVMVGLVSNTSFASDNVSFQFQSSCEFRCILVWGNLSLNTWKLWGRRSRKKRSHINAVGQQLVSVFWLASKHRCDMGKSVCYNRMPPKRQQVFLLCNKHP